MNKNKQIEELNEENMKKVSGGEIVVLENGDDGEIKVYSNNKEYLFTARDRDDMDSKIRKKFKEDLEEDLNEYLNSNMKFSLNIKINEIEAK